MTKFVNFLFPLKSADMGVSTFLLAMRMLFGTMLMTHGYQKLMAFDAMSSSFPDPLGVGSGASLGLAIFAEFFCAMGFLVGAFYRLALIPMIFTMIIAFFDIHAGDPFSSKELPFVYLMVYILMYIAGPGKLSLDYMVALRLNEKSPRKRKS